MAYLLRLLSSASAHVAVFVILTCAASAVRTALLVRRMIGTRSTRRESGRLELLLTGTFYNENWFRAHILPLSAAAALARIYVVTDRPLLAVDKVTYICPPPWVRSIAGRMIPRAAAMLWSAWRHRPDVVMGYHIMPNAVLALVTARWVGARAVYQCCGGPSELLGGGAGTENRLLSRLHRPSPWIETRLLSLVAQFDGIVTRGSEAVRFFRSHGAQGTVVSIPASVDQARLIPGGTHEKDYDLVTTGRLVAVKRLDLFIELVDALREEFPRVKAVIVGDGPERDALERKVGRRELSDHVHFAGHTDDVGAWLVRAKIFVLTSASEGLSIALAEGLMAGLPSVVTNVGDLGELVENDCNGYLIDSGELAAFTDRVASLLNDPERRRAFSQAAHLKAMECCHLDRVVARWDHLFDGLGEMGDPACSRPRATTGRRTHMVAAETRPYCLPWVGKSRYD